MKAFEKVGIVESRPPEVSHSYFDTSFSQRRKTPLFSMLSAAILIHIWRLTDNFTLSAVQKNITRGIIVRKDMATLWGMVFVCLVFLSLLKREGFRAPKKKSNFFVSLSSTLSY